MSGLMNGKHDGRHESSCKYTGFFSPWQLNSLERRFVRVLKGEVLLGFNYQKQWIGKA